MFYKTNQDTGWMGVGLYFSSPLYIHFAVTIPEILVESVLDIKTRVRRDCGKWEMEIFMLTEAFVLTVLER